MIDGTRRLAHPGEGRARKDPSEREQWGWADGDEVEGGGEGGHSNRNSPPRLPHVQLKHLGSHGRAAQVTQQAVGIKGIQYVTLESVETS